MNQYDYQCSLSIEKKAKRNAFSVFEDAQLIRLVSDNEDVNWIKIASNFKNRTARQCRERWKNYLNPNIKNDKWTDEEDKLLLQKVNEIGTCWSIIQTFFNGRSENSIKNRWHSHLKFKTVKKNGFFVFVHDNSESEYPNRKERNRKIISPRSIALKMICDMDDVEKKKIELEKFMLDNSGIQKISLNDNNSNALDEIELNPGNIDDLIFDDCENNLFEFENW